MASVDDDQLVTDQNWKCTKEYVENWMSPTFNDDTWESASISGTNSASDIHKLVSDISPNAKWIWTSNFSGSTIDKTVYCRGYFSK